jgi:protein-disulfide isomerase
MKRYSPFLIILVVLVVVIVAALVLFRSQRQNQAAPFAAAPSSQPVIPQSPVPTLERPAAPAPTVPVIPQPTNLPAGVSVTIEEFGDYQCPPCGTLHPELKKIAAEYGSKVNMIFRNFPLTTNHKNALAAAQAAEAARLQGHFDEMHDRIYEHQADWKDLPDPRDLFATYAKDIRLDLKRFAQDREGTEVQQKIAFDQQTGMARGVTGTPTVFVEGRQMKPEVTNLEGIRSGINIMLMQKANGAK